MKKDWKIVKIPEVLSFQEGPGVRKHQFTSEGVKLLNVGNINDGQINLKKTKIYISEKEAYGKYKHFLVDDGDLVIASSGIVVSNFHNKIAFISKEHLPLCMNTSTIRFKVIDKKIIDINYFKYFLKTNFFTNQLQRLITGSAQLNFGPSHLKKIDLVLPPLDDQKRIVKILDEADALHQKRKQAIGLLDDYLKSVFLEMFGDPVKNPMGWEVKELGKICDVRDGTHDSPKYQTDGFPLITSKNLRNGSIDFSEVNLVSEKDFISINKRSFVGDGDILMPMIGTIGNPIIVKKDRDFAIKNVALIKFSKGIVNNIYIKNLLGSYFLDNYILKKSRGGTQKFLSLSDIRNIEVPIPDINMQTKFSKLVFDTESLKQSMLAQSAELENQFQAFMQKAFKGEL